MRIAALYDIHGNLPALDAVLKDLAVRDVDLIVVGGDFVWGPQPSETLNRLQELADRCLFIRGNTEREVTGRYGLREGLDAATADSVAWCADELSNADHDFLRSLPTQEIVEVDGLGPTLFCHGSPHADDDIITRASPSERLERLLDGVEERTIVAGHTHVQFDRASPGHRIINPGSIGMPYEGKPGAYWALLGPDVELRRTTYDFDAAAASLRRSGFPGVDELVHELYVEVPSAEEATAVWEKRATARDRALVGDDPQPAP